MTELVGETSPRRLLLARGPDARAWLQGLLSNDVGAATGDNAVYAALLSAQGKYLFDMFLLASGPQDVLIDAAEARGDALAQRLKMYLLRRATVLEPVEDMGVARLWGAVPPAPPPGARLVADPRAAGLGWRLYAPDPGAALARMGARAPAPGGFDALRVRHGAPESDVELIAGESYILECGFARLNGVDFRKGCYVGQEVTARMRHKTTLRKGLARVAVTGAAPPPGTAIISDDGKPVGRLFTVAAGEGLAHLRFDRAEGQMRAGDAALSLITAE